MQPPSLMIMPQLLRFLFSLSFVYAWNFEFVWCVLCLLSTVLIKFLKCLDEMILWHIKVKAPCASILKISCSLVPFSIFGLIMLYFIYHLKFCCSFSLDLFIISKLFLHPLGFEPMTTPFTHSWKKYRLNQSSLATFSLDFDALNI